MDLRIMEDGHKNDNLFKVAGHNLILTTTSANPSFSGQADPHQPKQHYLSHLQPHHNQATLMMGTTNQQQQQQQQQQQTIISSHVGGHGLPSQQQQSSGIVHTVVGASNLGITVNPSSQAQQQQHSTSGGVGITSNSNSNTPFGSNIISTTTIGPGPISHTVVPVNISSAMNNPSLLSHHHPPPNLTSASASVASNMPGSIVSSVPIGIGPGVVGQTIALAPGSAVPISLASAARTLTSLPSGTVAFRSLSANPPPIQPGGQDSGDENVPSVSVHVSNSMACAGGSEPPAATPGTDSSVHLNSSQSEQRLKVEDALNYLDQVKYKFGNQPQVYNDFLDIMKEFKSQSIDTPGVITRVSHLFRGHPELIVGFNTFLPPGYKIEVSLSMVGQGGGYVVTTVQTGQGQGPGTSSSTTHQPNQPPSSSSIIQHSMPGLPVRSAVATVPPTITQQQQQQQQQHSSNVIASNIGPGVGRESSVPNTTNAISNGRSSPPTTSSLGPTSNNFETSNSTPTFTHSFSSPFVQSAFPSLQSQPVEFNHAINYVNKIKSRFQGQPDKYKQFLEILHTYQKEQRNIKEGLPQSAKHLTEHEVYSQVSKLFENQDDLLQEFGQFLPDATNHQNTVGVNKSTMDPVKKPSKPPREFPVTNVNKAAPSGATKRPTLQQQNTQAPKKFRMSAFKDNISLAEAGKYGSLNEFAFFDKVRQLVKGQDIYDNFLRCLKLYNDEILSSSELVQLVTPFLSKSPELYAWFKDFIGLNDNGSVGYEPVPAAIAKQDKLSEEQAMEIDFSTCKRLGASYCALPKNHVPAKCSGRTALCRELLNDVWVSFPTWSEDSTFITSRKTQFEEYIYRCEDERFELDVVIETNASTIRVLETVAKKMSRMSQEELNEFELDECIGGSSPTIHQRAVRRLYGEKAAEVIDGLRKQPATAVPLVLRRLKAKEEEWREAQKGFNKIWREQIERFYLKSLDHQGITFKQSDIRALRSKALISEIETIFDERHEQQDTLVDLDGGNTGPHLMFQHRDVSILEDANNLLIHHARRQSAIQKDDKRKIKQLLKQFIPDLFFQRRLEMTPDEMEDFSPAETDGRKSPSESNSVQNGAKNGNRKSSSCSKKTNGNGGGKTGEGGKQEDSTDPDCGAEAPLSSSQNSAQSSTEQHESRRSIAKRDKKLQDSAKSKQAEANAHSSSKDNNSAGIIKIREDILASENNNKAEEEDIDERYKRKMIHITNPDDLSSDESYALMFVNNVWYVFLRLHFILCERLNKIRERAKQLLEEELKEPSEKVTAASILRMRPKHDVDVESYYPFFLELVRNLLDGAVEPSNFEDTLRELFGIHAYVAYTLDKVIANAVRQLQTLVTDEAGQKCLELFYLHQRRGGAGGLCSTMHQRLGAEIAYQKSAEKAFIDDNCIKVVFFRNQSRITFELMENEPPPPSQTNENAKWAAYVEQYIQPGESESSDEFKKVLCRSFIFLPRNIRNWKKRRQQKFQGEINIPILPSSTNSTNSNNNKGSRSNIPIEVDEDSQDNIRDQDIKTEKETDETGDDTSKGSEHQMRQPKEEPEDIELDNSLIDSHEVDRKIIQDYIIQDNLQCQFNPNSYKMIFVVNSENFIYLKGALNRARKTHPAVSSRLNEAFGKWHQNWIENSVSEEDITRCEDWLMGVSGHTTLTKVISNNDVNQPPYRPYNKYKVVRRGSVE